MAETSRNQRLWQRHRHRLGRFDGLLHRIPTVQHQPSASGKPSGKLWVYLEGWSKIWKKTGLGDSMSRDVFHTSPKSKGEMNHLQQIFGLGDVNIKSPKKEDFFYQPLKKTRGETVGISCG